MNLNSFKVVGHLTKDVEVATTGTGKKYARFTVAVSQGYGERENTQFLNFTAWEKRAEFLGAHAKKGMAILVEGNIATRTLETQDGKKYTVPELRIDNVDLEFPRKAATQQPVAQPANQPVEQYQPETPAVPSNPADGAGYVNSYNELF